MKKLLFTLLAVLLLAGCIKEDSVTYSGIEAGTITSGVFISDNLTSMNIVGNEGNYDITSSRRVLVSLQTHPVTDAGRIDIDLLGLWEAIIIEPSSIDALPDAPNGSPIEVSDAWFGAGYLNILASFSGNDASLHALSASYKADENNVVIRLQHDGSKDTATGDKVVNVFLCIPMYEPLLSYDQCAIATGKKQGSYPAPVLLQWTSRTMEGGPLTLYERKGSYTPPVSGN